jgi:hypothetical protein
MLIRAMSTFEGGVNLGTAQYIDAYQRTKFWSIVQNNPNSHLLLALGGGLGVLPELTLNVPPQYGHTGSPFGHEVGEVDINYVDAQIGNYMTQHPQIQFASPLSLGFSHLAAICSASST